MNVVNVLWLCLPVVSGFRSTIGNVINQQRVHAFYRADGSQFAVSVLEHIFLSEPLNFRSALIAKQLDFACLADVHRTTYPQMTSLESNTPDKCKRENIFRDSVLSEIRVVPVSQTRINEQWNSLAKFCCVTERSLHNCKCCRGGHSKSYLLNTEK